MTTKRTPISRHRKRVTPEMVELFARGLVIDDHVGDVQFFALERTCADHPAMSLFDPNRKSSGPFCCNAHVHVGEGGQAVIGNVQRGKPSDE